MARIAEHLWKNHRIKYQDDFMLRLNLFLFFVRFQETLTQINKMMQSQLKTYFMESSFQEVIHLYLRNSKKQARLVSFKTPLNSHKILLGAAQQFSIPLEQIILFYNGFRINQFDGMINLTQKSILHVIDKRNIDKPQIYVLFKALGWNGHSFKLALSPDLSIKELLSHYIVPRYGIQQQKMFIVYVGKVLNHNNSLKEEFIEDGSELIIVQHKPIKEQFRKGTFQFFNSQNYQQNYESGMILKAPVTYQTSIQVLKKKSIQQANLQQQQVILQQNSLNIQHNQLNAAPTPAAISQDSFFKKDQSGPINLHQSGVPQFSILENKSKKKSSISSERNAPSSDQKTVSYKILKNVEHLMELLTIQDAQQNKLLKLQSNQYNEEPGFVAPLSQEQITNEKEITAKAIDSKPLSQE